MEWGEYTGMRVAPAKSPWLFCEFDMVGTGVVGSISLSGCAWRKKAIKGKGKQKTETEMETEA